MLNCLLLFIYRFLIEENINKNTGISLFCIFDGHGGAMAADFAKDILIQNLLNKIIETSNIVSGRTLEIGSTSHHLPSTDNECDRAQISNKVDSDTEQNKLTQRRQSFKKSMSKTEDYLDSNNTNNKKINIDSDLMLDKFKPTPFTSIATKAGKFKSAGQSNQNQNMKPETFNGKCYIENGKINFGKMLTDEILAADYALVEKAKRTVNTTPQIYLESC